MLVCTKYGLNGPFPEVMKTLEISKNKKLWPMDLRVAQENAWIGSRQGFTNMGHATSKEE